MNREIYPGSVYPLSGDVQSQAGDINIKVTGIQGTPVEATPLVGGEEFIYDPNIGQWVPILQATIQMNGVTICRDDIISVNVPRPVLVNGA